MPKACDQGGPSCAEGFVCDPSSTTPTRCVPQSCDAGYECEPWLKCDPSKAAPGGHGCVVVACSTDQECSCGYCVTGVCQPTLGICYEELPAMPYGCVWPDEELV
jgi:hypothetical protein